MTIPVRYRQTHPAWGVGLLIGLPLVMFGLVWVAVLSPRWIGLSPSDATLRRMVAEEGQALVSRIERFIAEHERPPRNLSELDAADGEADDDAVNLSAWSLINHDSGLMLVHTIAPNEVLEYVFADPRSNESPGWYRRTETGPRYVLRLNQ